MNAVSAAMYILVFSLGACVGSFLNVCILRIPEGQSVVTVPSHCPKCGRRLRWYELIPIMSFIFLRGRCSGCGERISLQYPIVEASNGLLYVLVFYLYGPVPETVFSQLFLSALLLVAFIDERTGMIPPSAVLFILVLAVVRLFFAWDYRTVLFLGAIVMGGLFLLILLLSEGRAMGGGDVKLVAACGLFLGLPKCALGFVLACFAGAVIHSLRMKLFGAGRELAFAPYLAGGFAVSLLFGQDIINWYSGLLR